MELRLRREALLAELGPMQGIIERRTTVPALTHVLLRAERGLLSLAATDMDISLTSEVAVELAAAGSLTVSARKLHEIVRAANAEQMRWQADDRQVLTIEAGRSRFRVRGLPAGNFPSLPDLAKEPVLAAVALEDLRRWISLVLFAVSSEQNRFQLSGALIKLRPGRFELVATDGHRLALVEVERPEFRAEAQLMVPRKALQEILRLEGKGIVELRRSEHHVSFRCPPWELCGRLLDGAFPDYEKVISREADKELEVDRREFLAAVERVSLLAGERNRGIRLALGNPEEFELSAANPDLGEASEQIGCKYRGESLNIAFNPDYLAQFLSAVTSSRVSFSLRDEMGQCVARPVRPEEGEDGASGEQYRCVIMPMRL